MADGFTFLGDALWLDFVNTGRGRRESTDRLTDADAYRRWTAAERLTSDADQIPFPQVLAFRAHLTDIARAMDEGVPLAAPAIEQLNALLTQVPGHDQLTRVGGIWKLRFAAHTPLAALHAVARSAAETLADAAVAVRQCAATDCTLFFADTSPTGYRRWCSADPCGGGQLIERRRSRTH